MTDSQNPGQEPSLVRAVGPLGTVSLHNGTLVTIDRKGLAATAARASHVEFPVTAVAAVDIIEPMAKKNGRLDLTVRTTEGDTLYDPKKPNPYSVEFPSGELDEFRRVARAIDSAKPAIPVAIEPPKPDPAKPLWKSGGFWGVIILFVLICGLIGSCGGGSDESNNLTMPDVTGITQIDAQEKLTGFYSIKYVNSETGADWTGFSGVVTRQEPKAGTKMSDMTDVTLYIDPQGKTKEQKKQEAEKKKQEELQSRANDCKDKDAATVIAALDADKLTGTIKTNSNVTTDMADTIRTGISQGAAYIVTGATVDNGRIDLIVDTVAHHNRELASQQIPALCETAGKQAYPYGFKVPWFSDHGSVLFTDDANWTYTFQANVTNVFGATAKKTPVTCTGTLNGQDIQVTGIN